jgi:hypothetical protein
MTVDCTERKLATVRRALAALREHARGPDEHLYEPLVEALLAAGVFRAWPSRPLDVLFVTAQRGVFGVVLALAEKHLATGAARPGWLALRTAHALCAEYGGASIAACLVPEAQDSEPAVRETIAA